MGECYLALLGDVEVVDAAASQPGCGHPVAPVAADVIVHEHRLKPVGTLQQSACTSHAFMLLAWLSLHEPQGHGHDRPEY